MLLLQRFYHNAGLFGRTTKSGHAVIGSARRQQIDARKAGFLERWQYQVCRAIDGNAGADAGNHALALASQENAATNFHQIAHHGVVGKKSKLLGKDLARQVANGCGQDGLCGDIGKVAAGAVHSATFHFVAVKFAACRTHDRVFLKKESGYFGPQALFAPNIYAVSACRVGYNACQFARCAGAVGGFLCCGFEPGTGLFRVAFAAKLLTSGQGSHRFFTAARRFGARFAARGCFTVHFKNYFG